MSSLVREGKATLTLALPLMAGQVSQMLMSLVDTFMIGSIGTVELAASTLAHTILHLPLMVGVGLAIAVSIKVSQARGANKKEHAKSALRDGFFLSLLFGLVTFVLCLASLPLLPFMGQDPEVVAEMPVFYLLVSLSMTPAMASMVIRNHSDAMAKPWPVFWIVLGSVLLNALLNWLLIFGKWGFPELNLVGAGVATLLARFFGLLGLMVWCRSSADLRDWSPKRWFLRPVWKELREFWKLAWPSSLQTSAELSAFIFAAFFVGSFGAAALAAHQVALMCMATTFMVPLGLSMALTVQVGEAKGAGTLERFRAIVLSGWGMGLVVSLCGAAVFLWKGEYLAAFFLTEPAPLQIAVSLFTIGAIFQIADHSQILSSGVLRGVDDVRMPTLILGFSHWLIGIPLGLYLALHLGYEVNGIWWGLCAGLVTSAILLGRRAWKMMGAGKLISGD